MRVALSWMFYYAGDLWERATYSNLQNWFEWPYRVYQWLMCCAHDLQGDDPRGPWRDADD